jgi:hypothetical protein
VLLVKQLEHLREPR